MALAIIRWDGFTLTTFDVEVVEIVGEHLVPMKGTDYYYLIKTNAMLCGIKGQPLSCLASGSLDMDESCRS
jgi:hypothetical protein